MIVTISTSGLKRTKWWELLLRFVMGGLVTVGAGEFAQRFGPGLGGLFLAFPALLASSVTLVQKHEREGKQQKGMSGVIRGRLAAGADAAGAAMGSIGLIAFAVCAWKLLPHFNPWLAISGATLVWAMICAAVWYFWKRNFMRRLKSDPSGRRRPSK
jgi:hypothetical protein